MLNTINLAYGKGHLPITIDDQRFAVHEINPHNPPALSDPHEAFLTAARNPIGSQCINTLAQTCGKSHPQVAIVIADHTRPVPDKYLVPWIVDELGVSDECICIIMGTGTHRATTDAELVEKLGAENVERFRIVNHNCETSDLVHVGDSSCGGPCLLNKLYVDADIKIVTGFIEPHFFAGFSGGSKGVMPGVAGLDTVRHFHRNTLIADPTVSWGNLEDNALQALCREMVSFCPPDVMVNVTLNLDKEITGVFIGDVVEAHRVGCKQAIDEAMIQVPQKYPLVITTNSGYPLDQNYYQSVKGISAASRICEDGGHIIIACECSAGLPHDGEFADILAQDCDNNELLQRIMDAPKTRHDQWQVQCMLQIAQHAQIHLYSQLNDEDQRLSRVHRCNDIMHSIESIADDWNGDTPMPIAVLPRGPLTIPTCSN